MQGSNSTTWLLWDYDLMDKSYWLNMQFICYWYSIVSSVEWIEVASSQGQILTNTRHILAWTAEWENCILVDWIKGSFRKSKNITWYDSLENYQTKLEKQFKCV